MRVCLRQMSSRTPQSDDGEAIVELSPFNVTAGEDDGYQARNTASGSLINSALKDTSATISAFTEEFLQDVGATSIEEMLTFAGNVESESEDATNGFNDNPTRWAGNLDNRFRIRGIAGAVTTDYAESGIPTDLYNIERAEIASGANSILFGLGAQGGVLTMTSKRANVQRTTLNVTNILGTWFNPGHAWNFERLTFDYNLVLIPKKWALRLQGIYQDGGPASWRYWQGHHQKRINPVITIKPFKGTTINIAYEKGRVQEATTRRSAANAADQISGWYLAGKPLMQGFGAEYAPPGIPMVSLDGVPYMMYPTTQINAGGANPSFVFVNNNNTMYDVRQTFRSMHKYDTSHANVGQYRLPADISPYTYSTVGPSGVRQQDFERWSAAIEQRLGKVNFLLSYNHNKTTASAHSPGTIDAHLYGDPNKYLSSYAWGGGYPNVVENDYQGRLYMEDTWMMNLVNQRNDSVRLSTEYTLNLKQFGRHRLVNLLEHTENELFRNTLNEILVDDFQVPIQNVGAPNAAVNQVTRRHYVTEGDFRTYYQGDWRTPIEGMILNGRTFHSTYVTDNQVLAHVKRKINSAMLVAHSYWFNDRLVTTLGLRVDDVRYTQERLARVTDPSDPRILNKSKVLNEWALNGRWDPPVSFTPWTFSSGAVWHVNNRISGKVNYSTNRGAPYLDGRTVLPTGGLPEMTKGVTYDYGVIFDLTGNGKFTLTLTRFNTKQIGDATITPAGIASASNGALGSTNLFNIYDALYFLQATSQTGVPTNPAFAGRGPMTAQEYAVWAPSVTYPHGSPPQYNAGTVDVKAQGYELELTARPTRNIDLRWVFSYTKRDRVNIFPEIFGYYNSPNGIARLLEIAQRPNPDPAFEDGRYHMNNNPLAQTVYEYVRNQIWGGGGVRQGLNNQLFNQSGPLGARPFKSNLTAKYSFREGALKGFVVGGSVRYESPNFMPDPNREGKLDFDMPPEGTTDLQLDPDIYFGTMNMLKGNSRTFFDMFCVYRFKLMGGRTTATFRLNINNIFTNNIVTPGRTTVDGTYRRVYVAAPRAIRISTAFDF